MATLYIRIFPDLLYEEIRWLAKEYRCSISIEVIDLMTDAVERIQCKRQRLAGDRPMGMEYAGCWRH